ncbi:MAG: hypothetical protein IPM18_15725 [Phycisphaerales bacterium]|nr:hypothetical protein [Phycisphaerales bacterium]
MDQAQTHPLPPDVVRANLVRTALFLTSYQLLRNAVVDGVRNCFLQVDWNYPEYDQQVLTLARSRFQASLRWLVAQGVLEPLHVDEIYEIRRHRNKIAYDLPRLLIEPHVTFDTKLLDRIGFYLQRLEAFFATLNTSAPAPPIAVGPTITTASSRLLEQLRTTLVAE